MSRLLYIAKKKSAFSPIKYGLLYNWWAATDSRNICSSGFHLATQSEYDTLFTYLGGIAIAGTYLKESGTVHWNAGNTGTNSSGFTSVGSSWRVNTGAFDTSIKGECRVWNSTVYTATMGRFTRLGYSGETDVTNVNVALKNYGFALRVMKDSTTLTNGQTGTYVDPSGMIYPTICIGTQEWVACNIMTKHYRNGDAIPEVTDNTTWSGLTTGARCSYNNIESNAGTTKKMSSSDNFIVPTKTIWENFFNSLDTYDSGLTGWPILGTKLREIGWSHWLNNIDSIEGTDDYGFKLAGSGSRDNSDGVFGGLKDWVQIWSSTDILGYPYAIYTSFSLNEITDSNGEYRCGYSIRLCNPTTSHTNGYVGSYTQNDGTVIPTIVINGVEWTMNLKETKWSDGTWITGFDGGTYTPITNANWVAKTTEACCAYNDDLSNI